jgi:NhaP-type Na+/H+ or K+/H+ antiporter
MVFVAFGVAIGSLDVFSTETMSDGVIRVLAEATLVLLLFTDAIRIDLRKLRPQIDLPARLLGIGLPLTVIAGTFIAKLIFSDFSWAEAALVAAILSPTDAALGQAVVSSSRVPVRIRQVINVESGLNDGLMLPVITLLLALAASGYELGRETSEWIEFAARQIGFGVLVGVVIGYAGGRLLDVFSQRGWVEGAFRQLATLAIGVVAFAAAEPFEGNGFVAAFVAGLAFGVAAREHCSGAYDFAEDEGQLLALLTFMFFGAAIALPALDQLTFPIALYAIASLTIVRMIPVATSLLGAGLRTVTMGFVGWFGPRGLASILFGLFILEEAEMGVNDEIFLIVTWTVLISVFAHGLTAVPLAARYGSWFERHHAERMAEAVDVEEMPTR